MIRTVRSLAVVVVVALVASLDAATAQEAKRSNRSHPDLPDGHPILDPYLAFQRPGMVRIGRQQAALSGVQWPEVKLEVPRRRYVIGEPIWATLTFTNASDRFALRFSPPYAGQHVSTLGVWRARWDWLRGGQFVGPLEVVPLNKGSSLFPPVARCYGGVPVVLKPGESYAVQVPLNVAQQVHPITWHRGGPRLAWFAGVGLTEPGRYRL